MKQKNRGFTFIELLVATAIIALISSMVFANLRQGEKRYKNELAVQEFMSTVRYAQHLALSSHERGGEVPYGYGIYCESVNSYVIFYNLNPADGNTYDPIKSYIFKRNNISPVQFDIDNVGDDVFFIPPYPIIYVNDKEGENRNITFTFNLDLFTEEVTVYGTGSIKKD